MRSSERLQATLASLGLQPLSQTEADQFGLYVELLLRWNAKVNLTSIRDEDLILRRHFVESIQCARLLPTGVATLLDYGSGGGFPGLPCAICRPKLTVTLAESQGKKAAFLREVTRAVQVKALVHGGRVDALMASASYDVVTLRAVDHMREACIEAFGRVRIGGWIAVLTTDGTQGRLVEGLKDVTWREPVKFVGSEHQILLLGRKRSAT